MYKARLSAVGARNTGIDPGAPLQGQGFVGFMYPQFKNATMTLARVPCVYASSAAASGQLHSQNASDICARDAACLVVRNMSVPDAKQPLRHAQAGHC